MQTLLPSPPGIAFVSSRVVLVIGRPLLCISLYVVAAFAHPRLQHPLAANWLHSFIRDPMAAAGFSALYGSRGRTVDGCPGPPEAVCEGKSSATEGQGERGGARAIPPERPPAMVGGVSPWKAKAGANSGWDENLGGGSIADFGVGWWDPLS